MKTDGGYLLSIACLKVQSQIKHPAGTAAGGGNTHGDLTKTKVIVLHHRTAASAQRSVDLMETVH